MERRPLVGTAARQRSEGAYRRPSSRLALRALAPGCWRYALSPRAVGVPARLHFHSKPRTAGLFHGAPGRERRPVLPVGAFRPAPLRVAQRNGVQPFFAVARRYGNAGLGRFCRWGTRRDMRHHGTGKYALSPRCAGRCRCEHRRSLASAPSGLSASRRDKGLRLDHLFGDPAVASRLRFARTDRSYYKDRDRTGKPDHASVIADLDPEPTA